MDRCSEPVRRAADATAATIQDMGINHGCAHIFVTQKLLNSSNVTSIFQEISGERVPKHMVGGRPRNTCFDPGLFKDTLYDRSGVGEGGVLVR